MKKKLGPLMVCHLVFMAIMLSASLFLVATMLCGIGFDAGTLSPAEHLGIRMNGVINLLNALAILSGMVYLCHEYGRKAKPFYALCVLLQIAVCIVNILAVFLCEVYCYFGIGIILIFILYALIKPILLLLFSRSGPGRKKRRILLAILLLDVASAVLFFAVAGTRLGYPSIINPAAKLVLTGTVGLSLMGTYENKISPETVV